MSPLQTLRGLNHAARLSPARLRDTGLSQLAFEPVGHRRAAETILLPATTPAPFDTATAVNLLVRVRSSTPTGMIILTLQPVNL
jgi:hypothetical protein